MTNGKPTALAAIVPCLGPVALDARAIRDALQKMDPNGRIEITVGDTPAIDGGQKHKGILLSYEGLSMAVLSLDASLPISALDYGTSPNFLWPSAKADLGKHNSHLQVLITDGPTNRSEMIVASQALTLLTAAACQVVKPLGVLWCPSDNLVPIDRFLTSTNALLTDRQTPADIWIRLQAVQTARGIVVSTKGLSLFTGRELELLLPSQSEFSKMAVRMLQIAVYLIDRGVALKDGETIGSENLAISLLDQGKVTEGPVYELSCDNSQRVTMPS